MTKTRVKSSFIHDARMRNVDVNWVETRNHERDKDENKQNISLKIERDEVITSRMNNSNESKKNFDYSFDDSFFCFCFVRGKREESG